MSRMLAIRLVSVAADSFSLVQRRATSSRSMSHNVLLLSSQLSHSLICKCKVVGMIIIRSSKTHLFNWNHWEVCWKRDGIRYSTTATKR